MELGLTISSVIFIIAAYAVCDIERYIFVALFFVFFPIIIPFMGRDAITTGTICIFLLYLKYLKHSWMYKKEKYDRWIYLLIGLGTVSIIFPFLTGALTKNQIGPAVRHYIGFLGAILLFIVIKNHMYFISQKNCEAYNRSFEKLINFILLLMSIHVLIAIGIRFFPALGSIFQPFLSRDMQTLDVYSKGGIERIGTFVFTYEALAEILAALAPIVLYKLFTQRASWIFIFFLFSSGVLLTATRSGILLFSGSVFISVVFHFRRNFGKTYMLTYSLITITILLSFFNPSSFGDLTYRFQIAADAYRSGGTFTEIINRHNVFIRAWESTSTNLSIFGNGLTEFNYHNLILTILHQMGILGAFIFFGVLLYPLSLLIKNYPNDKFIDKSIFFSCLLSLTIFFINECKYEFIRFDSYQQICWGIFATYYLMVQNFMAIQKPKKL